jgi:diaminopimelate decarboxylase
MSNKNLPLGDKEMRTLADTLETPFHLYDEKAIRENARAFTKAFSWVPGFKNYYAVKACPNPEILKILKEEGFGADCSSLPELILSQKAGINGEDIMFTSNDTPPEEFKKAYEMNAVINLDDITHIETLQKAAGIPDLIGPVTQLSEILLKQNMVSLPNSFFLLTRKRKS